jgi:xanthine dehydrogenase YagT iron-sulfur-binding subunit
MEEKTKTGTVTPDVPFTQESAQQRAVEAIESMIASLTQFRCPLCGKIFGSFADLKFHYTSEHPDAIMPITVALNINGKSCEILIEPHWTLQRALQFRLGLTGSKHMCDRGACGSCTVIMDGRAVLSCTMLAAECEGKAIQTIEGIAANPKWKPLIDAYCRWDAMQCGYCTPGFLVSAKALLDKNPTPPRTISARRLPETSASAALIRVTLQQFWKLR